MPNSYTEHSRQLRQETAIEHNRRQVEAGSKRLSVILPPESVLILQRLSAIYGTQKAAIIAALKAHSDDTE